MPDHLATLDIDTPNQSTILVQKLVKGIKVTYLTRRPKVWCYATDFFLQALKQVQSTRTRLVEVFHYVDVRVCFGCVDA